MSPTFLTFFYIAHTHLERVNFNAVQCAPSVEMQFNSNRLRLMQYVIFNVVMCVYIRLIIRIIISGSLTRRSLKGNE